MTRAAATGFGAVPEPAFAVEIEHECASSSSVKALQLVGHGKPGKFEVRNLADPVPGPGEAVVDVRACGLNRLDLWVEEAGLPIPLQLPRTPGGEASGVVSAVASDVAEWQPGDRVAIQSNIFCGTCEFCLQGEESMCLVGKLLGVQVDGGFAERVLVPARVLVRLPDEVSFEQSAALTLAGSTAMHMLTHRTRVEPGQWVLVIGGASGVGSAAIQIAKALGANVISTGSNEEKRKLAESLGADHVVDANDPRWPALVRHLSNKRGADVVVEHVGGDVLVKVFECLARNGTVVTCGATAGREVPLNLWPFFVKQQRLIGSYGRNRADMRATLEWCAAGKLKPVIHSRFPLDRGAEAFEALRSRSVLGKVLITTGSEEGF
jgi:2-desacetyl-2-hydroxyethyl bacteriochlorophyllide A dehydrogenase